MTIQYHFVCATSGCRTHVHVLHDLGLRPAAATGGPGTPEVLTFTDPSRMSAWEPKTACLISCEVNAGTSACPTSIDRRRMVVADRLADARKLGLVGSDGALRSVR